MVPSVFTWRVVPSIVYALLFSAFVLWACDDDSSDAGDDASGDDGGGDADGDADGDSDGDSDSDLPPLDCPDNSNNMMQCMLPSQPDDDERWGVWCGIDCRTQCQTDDDCPSDFDCYGGAINLCMPEGT